MSNSFSIVECSFGFAKSHWRLRWRACKVLWKYLRLESKGKMHWIIDWNKRSFASLGGVVD